jgi:Holliday junction resolvase
MKRGQTNYEKGVRVERLARKLLEDAGYYVIRSAGSKGAADLVAIDETHVQLIQVKVKGQVNSEAKNKLEQIKVPAGVDKVIWEYLGRNEWEFYPVGASNG